MINSKRIGKILGTTVMGLIMYTMITGQGNGCTYEDRNTVDAAQQAAQNKILAEGNRQTGMPAITKFRERKMLKEILELRDQENYLTHTYTYSEHTGKFRYLGQTIGYGIPYATQYTNPQKIAESGHQYGYAILPQADPNGLFSPASAEGTWILMKDPNSTKISPVYVEPRILVSGFMLPDSVVLKD